MESTMNQGNYVSLQAAAFKLPVSIDGIQLVPDEKLHCTLIYSTGSNLDPQDVLEHLSSKFPDKVLAHGYAFDMFESSSEPGTYAIVLKIRSAVLELIHEMLKTIGCTHSFPTFSPHVTIAYGVPEADAILAVSQLNSSLRNEISIYLHTFTSEVIDTDWASKIMEIRGSFDPISVEHERAILEAKEEGYSVVLYVDSKANHFSLSERIAFIKECVSGVEIKVEQIEKKRTDISSIKLVEAVKKGNVSRFRQLVPEGMKPHIASKIYESLSTRDTEKPVAVFSAGDIVLVENEEKTVLKSGSNYLLFTDNTRSWVADVEPTGRVDEAVKMTQAEKLKAAKIVASALGYNDTSDKTDPSAIVNLALRGVRSKPLNQEAKAILGRMLTMLDNLGIKYDKNLAPMTESVSLDEESSYARLRKLHLRMHEELDDAELDSLEEEIDEADIFEYAYEDDEFVIIDEDTGEVLESELPENTDQINEVLSRIERLRAKTKMVRTKAKRERAERIALKKKSSPDVIAKRARRLAVKTIEKRIAKKPLNQLSVAEKERVEKRIAIMKPAITKLALRLVSKVRGFEKDRLSH